MLDNVKREVHNMTTLGTKTMPLKNRTAVPPGGKGYWIFFEARTNKHFSEPTFGALVTALRNHRLANPRFSMFWTTDQTEVENEVDEYTCLRIGGDSNWCTGHAPPGFSSAPLQRQQRGRDTKKDEKDVAGAGEILYGIATLAQWFGEGAEPVERKLAEERAAICVSCPKNSTGDWKRFFTVPAANAIQTALSLAKAAKIETTQDEKLNVCEACGCSIKLKVHVGLKWILKNTQADVYEKFDSKCWIKSEPKS